MKPVLAWMKSNLAIVVLSALILLILPAAFVGSSMWNKQIRSSRETAVSKAMSDLNSLRISYVLPATTPSGTPQILPLDAPNPRATEFFKEHRAKLDAEVAKVADAAKAINQGDHKMLVEGIFKAPPPPVEGQAPEPAKPTEVDQLKAVEFAELLVGSAEHPSKYQALLKGINAGGPADPVAVADALKEEETRFLDTLQAQHNRDKPTDEEQAALTKKLVDLRIAQYQRHARDVSVYATMDCLPGDIPRSVPSQPPDAATCYQWQYDYWVIADLLRAVDEANRDSAGRRTGVPDSVVKRIEKIKLADAAEPTDPSVTGRRNSLENKVYDVRHADMTLIVSSAGLPALVNAVARTNFMTVLNLDFAEADAWADIELGYFYGTDHVVKVTVKIETVWLRSWTEPLMPQQVKDVLLGAGVAGQTAPNAPAPIMTPRQPPRDETPKTTRPTTKSKPTRRGGDGGGGG